MRRGLKLLIITVIIVLACIVLNGCREKVETESPLKKTLESINKSSKKSGNLQGVKVYYNQDKESLEIGFYSESDIDKAFDILSRNIKNKSVGTIYLHTLYSVDDEKLAKINERVSKLNPKSIMVFGMDRELMESKNTSWTKVLSKVDTLYLPGASVFYNYDDESKKNLRKIKKVWLYEDDYSCLSPFTDLEEVGIYATVESTDDRASTRGNVYGPNGSVNYGPTVAPYETATNKNGKTIKVKAKPQPFDFDESYKEPEDYAPLKDAKKLKRLTIAPCFEKYKINMDGSGYLFALSNVRNDIMINEPNTKISENNYVNIEDFNQLNTKLTKYTMNNVVKAFMSDEVKSAYNKAKKFKKNNKTHRITGKALVYMAKPDTTMYKKKRVYHSSGNVLDETQLGNKYKMPERANDYEYFVYIYPTYKYFGKYNKGTKAYTETYWVEVFDMDHKIAYKKLKIGSKRPENQLRYSGTPPVKHAGTVPDAKVYKYIKNIIR